MIENLIHIFNKIGLTPNAEEIADVLWLASHLDEPESSGMPKIKPSQDHIDSSAEIPKPDMKKPEDQDQSVRSTPESESAKTGVYPPEPEEKEISDSGMGGLPFRSPAASALPGQLAIERALRPLMRKVPSRSRSVLDEEATVRQIAETDIWLPVMRPEPSRWLDVILLVDDSRSMVIWHQTISELKSLLERQGAFRNVRLQGFEASRKNPKELIDLSRQRLILLISDCVSEAWYDGSAAKMMSAWKNNSLIAIVQMLPHWLWERTALDYAESVYLRASYPGTVNAQLDIEQSDAWFDETPAQAFPIPVITLEPLPVSSWAKSVAGLGGKWIPGVVLQTSPCEDTESEDSQKSLSPEEQFRLFKATASPTARQLAGYLAAVPLTLPIMRLVQQVMMPHTSQIHLAEVFLSGLIKRQDTDEIRHPDRVRYEFIEGIRDILISSNLISETVDVIGKVAKKVSVFIDKNTGKPLDFQAMIADPSLADQALFANDRQAFAYVSAHVLNRLGGKYAQLSNALEKQHRNRNQPPHKPEYNLRREPITVSEKEFKKIFGLDKNGRPLEYIPNDFKDNGDGTITDHTTGLVWQKVGSSTWLTDKDANTYIQKLNSEKFAEYDDWRLPTVDELKSLLTSKKINSGLFINPIFDEKQQWCWTSDRREGGKVWLVNFLFGDVDWDDLNDIFYVRAVRSSRVKYEALVKTIEKQRELSRKSDDRYSVKKDEIQNKAIQYELRKEPITVSDKEVEKIFELDKNWRPLKYIQNDFRDNGNDIVIDNITGLMWQKLGSEHILTYNNAIAFIKKLNRKKFAGYSNWRLPTVDELKSLLTPNKMNSDLYIDPIFSDKQRWCWTSDQRVSGGAWLISFEYGSIGWNYFSRLYIYYVRAVRSIHSEYTDFTISLERQYRNQKIDTRQAFRNRESTKRAAISNIKTLQLNDKSEIKIKTSKPDNDEEKLTISQLISLITLIKQDDKLIIKRIVHALDRLEDENDQRNLASVLIENLKKIGFWNKHPLKKEIEAFLHPAIIPKF